MLVRPELHWVYSTPENRYMSSLSHDRVDLVAPQGYVKAPRAAAPEEVDQAMAVSLRSADDDVERGTSAASCEEVCKLRV